MAGGIPTFETDRLQLRVIQLDDAPSYTLHFVDYEVIRHLASGVPWPYPDQGVADYLKNNVLPYLGVNRWMWGIFLNENREELIGAIEMWRPGTPENRGFWLGRQFWGRGIMGEAIMPLTDYAFDGLGFDVLVLSNAKGNMRSRRVKERVGARLLRVEPASFVDKTYTEREIWELTKAEWYRYRGRVA